MAPTKAFLAALLAAAFAFAIPTGATHARPSSRRVVKTLADRIIDGVQIEIVKMPSVCSMRIHGSHICGCSVIGERCVLTAAHCCDHDASTVSVNAGSSFSNFEGQVREVTDVIKHPNYNGYTMEFDFCVLKLATSLDLTTESCKTIGLNDNLNAPSVGEICNATGWGATNPDRIVASKNLMTVGVPVKENKDCQEAYPYYFHNDSMFCAAWPTGHKDSCQGDSGGPLVDTAGCLVGVVSFGIGCGEPSYPGVYASAAVATDWVLEQCADGNKCSDVLAAAKKAWP